MIDREKVIKELERLSEWLFQQYKVVYDGDAPNYYDAYNTVDDTIALLEEQEPVEPDGENCGECGYTLHRINYDGPGKELWHEWLRFCPVCGKEVKWDG